MNLPQRPGAEDRRGQKVREAAARALERVHRDGAFLNLALRGVIGQLGLGPRDAALATALATGVLRWQTRLDHALARASRRPLERIELRLLELLRVAAYEVGFSRSVPAPVACDLAVRAAHGMHRGAAAFANAVLRRLTGSQDAFAPPEAASVEERLAVAYSHPLWLVRRWVRRFGPEQTEALLSSNNQPTSVSVRVNRLWASPQGLVDLWSSLGIQAVPGRLLPGEALVLDQLPLPVNRLPGYEEGLFTPQSEAAMLPGLVADPAPGERFIDLAAAPGGKTTHLAERAGDRGTVLAVDRHPGRLGLVTQNAHRLRLKSIGAVVADGSAAPVPPGWADGVLLDAPCSDLGVLGRRPDVRYRRRPEELHGLVNLQRQLLLSAADLLRPGGRLVYSVCSFEEEETVEQVRWLVEQRPDLAIEEASPYLPRLPDPPEADRTCARGFQQEGGEKSADGAAPAAQGWVMVLPHRHRTDGFFVVRFLRRRRH